MSSNLQAPTLDLRPPSEIARRSKSSFLVSFGFLERDRRSAMVAIYAFCRVVDDAADDPGPIGFEQIASQ